MCRLRSNLCALAFGIHWLYRYKMASHLVLSLFHPSTSHIYSKHSLFERISYDTNKNTMPDTSSNAAPVREPAGSSNSGAASSRFTAQETQTALSHANRFSDQGLSKSDSIKYSMYLDAMGPDQQDFISSLSKPDQIVLAKGFGRE